MCWRAQPLGTVRCKRCTDGKCEKKVLPSNFQEAKPSYNGRLGFWKYLKAKITTFLSFPGKNCPNVNIFLVFFVADSFKIAAHKGLQKKEKLGDNVLIHDVQTACDLIQDLNIWDTQIQDDVHKTALCVYT